MNSRPTPDLERIAARQVAALLRGRSVGSPLKVDPTSEICDTLELFIPKLLRRKHPEWERESIDGFFFSSAVKSGEGSAELVGTCILISDQTVTPFAVHLSLSEDGTFRSFGVRLGEPGQGSLGISGPGYNSPGAKEMLSSLARRLDQVDWVYDVAL